MARTKVTMDARGSKALLKDDGVRRELRRRAEQVAAAARASAPVRTGNYRAGIKVVDDTTDRAVVRVGSTAPHAHLVEARTGNLARALDAAGGE